MSIFFKHDFILIGSIALIKGYLKSLFHRSARGKIGYGRYNGVIQTHQLDRIPRVAREQE
jgi:heterodisulfide reductase subunit A-like polyferredoxin